MQAWLAHGTVNTWTKATRRLSYITGLVTCVGSGGTSRFRSFEPVSESPGRRTASNEAIVTMAGTSRRVVVVSFPLQQKERIIWHTTTATTSFSTDVG